MSKIRFFRSRIVQAQWVLIITALLSGVTSILIGISDNPPGIVLLMAAIGCLTGAWVWSWRTVRSFWKLLAFSLLLFPVGTFLHNMFHGLANYSGQGGVLAAVSEFLSVFFFLASVLVSAPMAAVGLLGGINRSWSSVSSLTLANRSIRRFFANRKVTERQLQQLVRMARQSASGANLQPLKFLLSYTRESNELIFPTLSWAGYLKDWSGPDPEERPAGYLILLGDTDLAKTFEIDTGIASQSITLGATEMGLGACLIGSIQREQLREAFAIPEKFKILLVIALGKPAEQVVLEAVKEDGDIKYWRDDQGVHHVPKRKLDDLIWEPGE